MLFNLKVADRDFRLEVNRVESVWRCRLDGREFQVSCAQIAADTISLLVDGVSFEARRILSGPVLEIFINGKPYEIAVQDPKSLRGNKHSRSGEHRSRALTASMPGKVVRLLATEGDAIRAGQGIVIIEAMKMQNEIRSPKEGVLLKLVAREGVNVNAGEVLALIE
jgi:biotin carboxyl carrier protein